MSNEILLEAGTNEMELLVFRLGSTPFGINVAKVREIIQRPKTIVIPRSPLAVEGSFRLRERVLTLLNLGRYFTMESEKMRAGEGMIIVVEFNSITCGVLVDSVERIYRLHWDQIESPSQFLIRMSIPVTGVVKVADEIVQIADFETIVGTILGVQSATMLDTNSQEQTKEEFADARIILADDSHILRNNLESILRRAGFENLTICNDGQEVWDQIQRRKNEPNGPCDLVLTDIEMPRMDGLHLTRRIKEDTALKNIPVILFSSLITDDNRRKGQAVGADAQVSKPDSRQMIEYIREFLRKRFSRAAELSCATASE
ncbi:MAG: chemotaxis protein CheV [Sedimentisphaerales bacterium]|nr:chemotaxis protein CheV [Sedimentisphaerales bacterium]